MWPLHRVQGAGLGWLVPAPLPTALAGPAARSIPGTPSGTLPTPCGAPTLLFPQTSLSPTLQPSGIKLRLTATFTAATSPLACFLLSPSYGVSRASWCSSFIQLLLSTYYLSGAGPGAETTQGPAKRILCPCGAHTLPRETKYRSREYTRAVQESEVGWRWGHFSRICMRTVGVSHTEAAVGRAQRARGGQKRQGGDLGGYVGLGNGAGSEPDAELAEPTERAPLGCAWSCSVFRR